MRSCDFFCVRLTTNMYVFEVKSTPVHAWPMCMWVKQNRLLVLLTSILPYRPTPLWNDMEGCKMAQRWPHHHHHIVHIIYTYTGEVFGIHHKTYNFGIDFILYKQCCGQYMCEKYGRTCFGLLYLFSWERNEWLITRFRNHLCTACNKLFITHLLLQCIRKRGTLCVGVSPPQLH